MERRVAREHQRPPERSGDVVYDALMEACWAPDATARPPMADVHPSGRAAATVCESPHQAGCACAQRVPEKGGRLEASQPAQAA
jgi:hypothetical protein